MKRKTLLKIGFKIPFPIIDRIFLTFPFLYKLNIVRYESGTPQQHIDLLINSINEVKNLPGDIIECGSNRCGTTSILAIHLKSKNISKKIFALDSFSGFIPEEIKKERDLGFTDFPENSYHYNSYSYVQRKIKKLKLSDTVILKKGYFQETLPTINSDFCVAFLDCDLGDSLNYAAEYIWPHLVKGGFLFFHDYGKQLYQNVKPVVDNFVKLRKNEIQKDGELNGMYYIKK